MLSRGWEVSLVLYPSTAEDSVSQFVRLTLTLTLDQQVGCLLSCPARRDTDVYTGLRLLQDGWSHIWDILGDMLS